MSFYPPKVAERFKNPPFAGANREANAEARQFSLVCGAKVEIRLTFDAAGIIEKARFFALGCGYLIAFADFMCQHVEAKSFASARNLAENSAAELFKSEFGEIEESRRHCAEICLTAMRSALQSFRRAAVWNGDDALVCSCFGVSEEDIRAAIEENFCLSVEDVTAVCAAGGGCGSCQPVIEDILSEY